MNKAALGLALTIEGCASCIAPTSIGFVPLYAIKTDPYTPSFASSYVAPEVEAVKERAESLEAFFNYKLARYELLKDYKGNKAELQRVDKFVRALREDKDLTVSDYTIVGYASPEGNFASNLTLSDNRAKTFASYLKEEYNVPNSKMKVSGKGEDWEGLKKAVAKSEIRAKNQIIDIITKTSDVYSRKAKLENLTEEVLIATC
jgi:Outer membrane protein and related peptidoglycan-associated (lipo)proteins